jgi:hypothetical protein
MHVSLQRAASIGEGPKLRRCDTHCRAATLHRNARVRGLDAGRDKNSYHSFFADHVEAYMIGEDRVNPDQAREWKINMMVRLVSLDQHIVERQGNVL